MSLTVNKAGVGQIINPEPNRIVKGISIIGLGVATVAALAEGIKFINPSDNIPVITDLLSKAPSTEISIMIGAVAVTTVVASQVLGCLCNRPRVVKEYSASAVIEAVAKTNVSMETGQVTVQQTILMTKEQADALINRWTDISARHHECMKRIHTPLDQLEQKFQITDLILGTLVEDAAEKEYKRIHGQYPYPDLPYSERKNRIDEEKSALRTALTIQFLSNDPEADKLISRPEFEKRLETMQSCLKPDPEAEYSNGYMYSSFDIADARRALADFIQHLKGLSYDQGSAETVLTPDTLKEIEEGYVALLEAEINNEAKIFENVKRRRIEESQKAQIKGLFSQSAKKADLTEEEKAMTLIELIEKCRYRLDKKGFSSNLTNEQVLLLVGAGFQASLGNNNNNNNNNKQD